MIALSLLVSPLPRGQTPLATQIAHASIRIDQLNLLHASVLDRARAWRSLAALQQDAALYAKSAASFAQAIQLFQAAPDSNVEFAEAIDGRGTLELETNQLAAAETTVTQVRRMRLAIRDTLGVARSDVHLANVYLGEAKYKQAYSLAQQALANFNKNPHADALDKSSAMIAVSLALCKQNRGDKARAY
jgi:tetratricopeptide (TPR) repeat protein